MDAAQAERRVKKGGWTRDVVINDTDAIARLQAAEASFQARLQEIESALQEERSLRLRAEAEAASNASSKKTVEQLSSAMQELQELSSQAAFQLNAAKLQARQRKQEAAEALQKVHEVEVQKADAIRRAENAELAQALALQSAKETEEVRTNS